MRQVALTVILAQIGSFVPALRAELPPFQRVFTRVGASDALSEGLSTFMVEMSETADILRKVDENSLVIMDEIGRGTSTYDGLALAQAILEFLLGKKRPFLLFATHYHELTSLQQIYPTVKNAHMTVQEKAGDIQFLHSLKSGPANRSYGIQVAKLAGVPDSVTKRAAELLLGLESKPSMQMSLMEVASQAAAPQSPLVNELADLNLSLLTPLQALNKLHELQQKLT
jgi:DNA mismatch repair protein MutS